MVIAEFAELVEVVVEAKSEVEEVAIEQGSLYCQLVVGSIYCCCCFHVDVRGDVLRLRYHRTWFLEHHTARYWLVR